MSDDPPHSNSSSRSARVDIAFLAAPLAVPLLMLPWLLSGGLPFSWLMTIFAISGFVSYGGTILFGVPGYRFLRARNYTGVWVAAVFGFAVGAVMWLVFIVLLALLLDSWSSIGSGLVSLGQGMFWPGGSLGAIVGLIFWAIARPDMYKP